MVTLGVFDRLVIDVSPHLSRPRTLPALLVLSSASTCISSFSSSAAAVVTVAFDFVLSLSFDPFGQPLPLEMV